MNNYFFKEADIINPHEIGSDDKIYLWQGFSDFDFEFYSEAFFRATKLILKKKSFNAPDDELVFPALYCTHMFIELALKH